MIKRIKKIKKIGHGRGTMCIEVDYFEASFWLEDNDGIPFRPLVIMFIHDESYFLFKTHIAISNERFMMEFFEQFLDVLEESEFLIGKLKVKKEDLADLFGKTAKDLGIKIELVKRLPAIEFAKKDFNSFLKNNLEE